MNNKIDAYAVLKIKDYRFFVIYRFFLTLAIMMQSVIVGWQVYEITKDPLSLGLIGLAEAIPYISIALFAGYVADAIPRKLIIIISAFVFLLGSVFLYLFTTHLSYLLVDSNIYPIYIVIFCMGVARGFISPSQSAFVAQLVPRQLYANSSTWNSLAWHIASVLGPAIGGMLYGFAGISNAYFCVVILTIIAITSVFFVSNKPLPVINKVENMFVKIASGVKFVFSNQILLSAMALDMLAVLFGGAVALLPMFADEILHAGPQGLGILRAAPAIGAVLMSAFLAYRPPVHNTGRYLLISVAGFGLSMIFFAISSNLYLSIFILFISGMFDNVSVVIRSTILQLLTPDDMRGRVASVNSIFIGSSNEIGSFESGVAAKFLGLIPSVIFGGVMTQIVVGFIAKKAPLLRKFHLKEIK